MVPCIGRGERVAGRRGAGLRHAPDRLGALAFAAAPPPRRPRRSPAGSTTSSRLPPTSTTTRCRSPSSAASPGRPANAGMVLSNSVSIQRVCTVNGVARRSGERRVAHDRAVERQHRRHALDLELGQRPPRPLQRLLPGRRR